MDVNILERFKGRKVLVKSNTESFFGYLWTFVEKETLNCSVVFVTEEQNTRIDAETSNSQMVTTLKYALKFVRAKDIVSVEYPLPFEVNLTSRQVKWELIRKPNERTSDGLSIDTCDPKLTKPLCCDYRTGWESLDHHLKNIVHKQLVAIQLADESEFSFTPFKNFAEAQNTPEVSTSSSSGDEVSAESESSSDVANAEVQQTNVSDMVEGLGIEMPDPASFPMTAVYNYSK